MDSKIVSYVVDILVKKKELGKLAKLFCGNRGARDSVL